MGLFQNKNDFILIFGLLLMVEISGLLFQKLFFIEQTKLSNIYERIKQRNIKSDSIEEFATIIKKISSFIPLKIQKIDFFGVISKEQSSELLLKLCSEFFKKVYLGPKTISENLWIIKPANSSKGREIKVFKDITEISTILQKSLSQKKWIIQKYIENPLLLSSRKFDIRFFVLISSIEPLVVWYYQDYYIRVSPIKYDTKNGSNLAIHLTNFSISKHIQLDNDNIFKERMISKTSFDEILDQKFNLQAKHKVNSNILNAVRSIFLITSELIEHRQNSFEMLGIDIMIDENLEAWILEVNASPSMECGTSITQKLIPVVTTDLIKVIVDENFGKSGSESIGLWKVLIKHSFIEKQQSWTLPEVMAKGSKVQNPSLI